MYLNIILISHDHCRGSDSLKEFKYVKAGG